MIALMLKGVAMGIAEVVPGVSGGTIAFITGIYEKLLNIISALKPSLLKTFKEKGVNGVWVEISGTWLLQLLSGMFLGIGIGVFGITYILEHYPVLIWSFFFGLIIASCLYIAKQITKWTWVEITGVAITTALAYYITSTSPSQGNPSYWFVFISGTIAISALILPGISGSFILLIMGMYTIIIPTLKEGLTTLNPDALIMLVVFGSGCLFGLLTFARVLSYTFKHYKNPTLAILTGFMIGSLNKIWPWRIPKTGLNEAGDIINLTINQNVNNFKILTETNVSPGFYELNMGESYLFLSLLLGFFGFVLIYLIDLRDN